MPRAVLPAARPVTITGLELLFRGFADPIRIRVRNVVVAGELCVCDLHPAGLVAVTRE